MSVSNLAEMAVMDRTTLARNLELLKREGLVRIRPGEGPPRYRLLVANRSWVLLGGCRV